MEPKLKLTIFAKSDCFKKRLIYGKQEKTGFKKASSPKKRQKSLLHKPAAKKLHLKKRTKPVQKKTAAKPAPKKTAKPAPKKLNQSTHGAKPASQSRLSKPEPKPAAHATGMQLPKPAAKESVQLTLNHWFQSNLRQNL